MRRPGLFLGILLLITSCILLSSATAGDLVATDQASYPILSASPVIDTGGAAQIPPEPGRHGITEIETPPPPTVVPETTSTPLPSPAETASMLSPIETTPVSTGAPSTPPDRVNPDAFASTDVVYALLGGLVLGGTITYLEFRRRLPLPEVPFQSTAVLVFALIAIGIIGSVLATQGVGQSWLLIVPVLQAGMFCTSIALAGGYLSLIRLPAILLFQGAGSAILVLVILITLVQHGQTALSPYALVLYGGSAAFSFWQRTILIRSAPKEGSGPTLALSAVTDPHPIAVAMAEKYRDIELIAVGGLARVYRARRKKDGAIVAVKVPLTSSEVTGTSFLKEILAWQSLSHPNIVSITDASILPYPAVEMEYIPQSLADLEKPMGIPAALKIVRGVASGLAYAHEKGVIHRDIKPENILLTAEGIPKITDWGMSRILASTMPTVVGFSVSYAAPEQISPSRFGSTDRRTDIFQLGVVFYELVTGSRPFQGEDSGEVIAAILDQEPIPPSQLVPAARTVESIIFRCLAKAPSERYQRVEDLLADLDRV
ncbi:MAG: serine/threonine protein kinase [Methanomicrobiales archaeon]|nr:serine/threonine protein kinase [Methanomicrobiales archaeon]